jgi:hypothetical protein
MQALSKLAPHIQQVSMESNGKGVDIEGNPLPFEAGEIDFGEPGTNGQHSFYQLIHQGRVVPCDFIGIVRSQQSVYLKVRDDRCLYLQSSDDCLVALEAMRGDHMPDQQLWIACPSFTLEPFLFHLWNKHGRLEYHFDCSCAGSYVLSSWAPERPD